jgi:hypothetical protein
MEVFFGWAASMGKGKSPAAAMNTDHQMVVAHVPSGHELQYKAGTRRGASVHWSGDEKYGDGREPSIAISSTHAVEVHRGTSDDRLHYGLGTMDDGRIRWVHRERYDTGLTPKIAINDHGYVLEIHHSQNTGRLWYNVGRISNAKIDWNGKNDFADGTGPAVAINNSGNGLVAYTRDKAVYYRILATDGKKVSFHADHKVAAGSEPSVAITDDGWYLLTYREGDALKQRLGVRDGSTVSWGNPVDFDRGEHCTIAAQSGLALQVHLGTGGEEQFYTTSLITNRSQWMTDRIAQLGPLPLRKLAFPGSHDAGMYDTAAALEVVAKTQDKNLHQQLTYGQRWFDLRVVNVAGIGIYIHHGSGIGPRLRTVLADVAQFMANGKSELVMLKFSHFGDFDTVAYELLVAEVKAALGRWLYETPLPANTTLGQLTLNDCKGRVLVLVDGHWAKEYPEPGFWIYRSSTAAKPSDGQLVVHDQYSDTDQYETMKEQQLKDYKNFTGKCADGTPVDLFLLSWTLTPKTLETVKSLAEKANPHLAAEVDRLPPNPNGIVNIFYVDYAQYARPTDVAITYLRT